MLQWAPVLGWSWKFQEVIFLERNWEKDKKNLGKQLNRLVNYPSPFFVSVLTFVIPFFLNEKLIYTYGYSSTYLIICLFAVDHVSGRNSIYT